MPRVTTASEKSAGGVLFRTGESGPEVCLISTRGGSRWQLPKGHLSAGETEAEAARREVREETGCDGEIQSDLGEIVFFFFAGAGASRKRVRKVVHFFLLRYVSGDTASHDAEVDDASWFPATEAKKKLTFDSERGILDRALSQLQQGAEKAG